MVASRNWKKRTDRGGKGWDQLKTACCIDFYSIVFQKKKQNTEDPSLCINLEFDVWLYIYPHFYAWMVETPCQLSLKDCVSVFSMTSWWSYYKYCIFSADGCFLYMPLAVQLPLYCVLFSVCRAGKPQAPKHRGVFVFICGPLSYFLVHWTRTKPI